MIVVGNGHVMFFYHAGAVAAHPSLASFEVSYRIQYIQHLYQCQCDMTAFSDKKPSPSLIGPALSMGRATRKTGHGHARHALLCSSPPP